MLETSPQSKALALRSLHEDGTLVLPNAWDAGSAVMIAEAGARAIATTSGGVAWSHGKPDGQRLSRNEMVGVIRAIAAAVDVPVTADIEGGYGPAPEDVAATVSAVVAVGAAGINLEDSVAGGGPLFTVAEQAARLRAAREAAARGGLAELVINARTDVYLFGIGAPEGRLDDVLTRASAYAEAGADCLFVPGLLDLEVLTALADEAPLPLNAMAMPGGPGIAELSASGVRRISTGTAVAQAAYTLAGRAATEILEQGTYTELAGALDFAGVDSLFAQRPH
ncbi:isocitrate lyase/PEP mutase family protein [Amycolatopsis aidingensis]|uniref:isocitrate lyase/PEP mutase family protein n=1 Tax=Amycolatopsis aidingensis TaxID=2842453 RepID=UPI001E5A80CD|nr:isocitrate lyase/phosphoenolpyruvate mutase family protein [Amycolatopsis aidingensis]